MGVLCDFYRSTVGKKVAMAVTGLVLVGFVVGHMAGNLKAFAGIDATGSYKIDHYGYFLREIGSGFFGHGGFLWIVRAVLLACVVIHVISAIQLARLNRIAKGTGYEYQQYESANAASRTMFWGGLFLLCFIVYHILHFTTGTVHYRGFVEGAVYANIWQGFQSSAVTFFYVAAMAALGFHLYHGVWSMFQTLGVDSPRWNGTLRAVAKITCVVVFIGFVSVPLAVAFGALSAPVAAPIPGH